MQVLLGQAQKSPHKPRSLCSDQTVPGHCQASGFPRKGCTNLGLHRQGATGQWA